MTSQLRCARMAVSFGAKPVLRDVTLDLERGGVLAIMGRSGSGKSTLLRGLATLERMRDGDAWLGDRQYLRGGVPIVAPIEIRRRVAMVFQQFNLFPNLSVLDNCTLGPVRALARSPDRARSEALTLLDSLGLSDAGRKFPEMLSGGEAQRVALIRALLMRPEVVLLDEITSALDPESIALVLETIRRVRTTDYGRDLTIVLVTHLLPFAESFADRIAFLHDGRVAETIAADRFVAEAASPAARKLIELSRYGTPVGAPDRGAVAASGSS